MQARVAASPFELSQEPVTLEGPSGSSSAPAPAPAPAYEHLGELPATYGTQSVYLVAYDPRQLFVYWDVDWAVAGDAVHSLHVCRADGEVESQMDIARADAGRYLPVRQPGGTYFVELGRRGRDGSWQPLAFSARVTMPPEGLSGETEPKFATLPFHLSFQRLLELIQGAMGRGENLTAALARLQRGDHSATTASLLNTLNQLNGEQLHTLGLLLGQKFSVSSGHDVGGSDSVRTILRDRAEALSSAGFGSEARLAGSAFGSEMLSSEMLTAGGALGSEALSSGIFASGMGGGSETLSSGGFGNETLASFVAGLSSETLSSFGLSSEMLAATMAGGSESLNSEAWRMAALGAGADSAGMDSERAETFRRALENNLNVLGALFSAVNSSLSSDFSPGSSYDLTSPGGT